MNGPNVAAVLPKMASPSGKALASLLEGRNTEESIAIVEDMIGWCLVLQTELYKDGGHESR